MISPPPSHMGLIETDHKDSVTFFLKLLESNGNKTNPKTLLIIISERDCFLSEA